MGNGLVKMTVCFTAGDGVRRRKDTAAVISDPIEDLGHSFCYVRPDPYSLSSSKAHSVETTTFRSISGSAVSANASTPLSTDLYSYNTIDRASVFESSRQFASIPLQPIPRNSMISGPIPANSGRIQFSGPMERGFLSGPIERGFVSGPIDRGLFSGPLEKGCSAPLQRSYSHAGFNFRPKSRKGLLIRVLQRLISKTMSQGKNSVVAPIKGVVSVKEQNWITESEKQNELTISSVNLSSECNLEDDDVLEIQNLQWAQGKAGEDRVHVVVSEENGWVFVGIYDGFNGPDAPDYLLSNLYSAVHKELKELLWGEKSDSSNSNLEFESSSDENHPRGNREGNCESNSGKKKGKNLKNRSKWEANQRRWRCEWDRERLELDQRLKEELNRNGFVGPGAIDHSDVLKALSRALGKTEAAYLEVADQVLDENPELALMGSCVLVMLMKGEDVYVMNVGDSRAVLAQKAEPDFCLERIKEETLCDVEGFDGDRFNTLPCLIPFQLTVDHSTSVEEEVKRIKSEHLDDSCAVMNDRVKGSLKVTRAFGAGFLKQPKWNNALLEAFRIDYIGTSSYITCFPSLYHHRLGPRDQFLILSSDGLYQYFTNEEAVSEVELFIQWSPEGDPAQHLVEEVLFRAAKKAGMDFHELLEIPQGDRRRYHDDISIIVISLEGRIWRSCV
ncbi:Protein like [Actinidia chinensis var. chinensis]|uniref:protein-serine/threonine phosphatase n=1 Tax=Actinidia chinensis var. chinensis TaxID=1590841 RepID=A0A2R6PPW1_ACTCC|nr:Protein like [Actinidia chinensis var. chinensis]